MKKLTKPILFLAILLIAIALLAGCKATGGGWFIDEVTGNKCTFGFNARAKGDEPDYTFKGQFQFKDLVTGQKIHIDEMLRVQANESASAFQGFDKDGILVSVIVTDWGEPGADAGDHININYNYQGSPSIVWYGYLEGGNIQTFE